MEQLSATDAWLRSAAGDAENVSKDGGAVCTVGYTLRNTPLLNKNMSARRHFVHSTRKISDPSSSGLMVVINVTALSHRRQSGNAGASGRCMLPLVLQAGARSSLSGTDA
jgi:hypothetical protein